MHIGIVTLFPEMFDTLEYGITGRALKKGLLDLKFWNPRDFALDKHRTVDDRPYGGGPGMVMMVQPLHDAIQAAKASLDRDTIVSYLSPQGKRLDQASASMLAKRDKQILVVGRYEGIDERIIELDIDEEWSIGDYILSGGELAAMVMIDAMTRLLPGALGDEESAQQESFANHLLDYPHFTRPEEVAGLKVPEVLLQGNHAAISRWRLKQALGRTWLRRPDLLQDVQLSAQEQALLEEFLQESSTK